MKLITQLFFLCLIVCCTACDITTKPGDGGGEDNSTFDGSYSTGLINSGSNITTSAISKNTQTVTSKNFDSTTGILQSIWVVTNDLSFGDSYLDGYKVDRVQKKAVVTLYTDDAVSMYNNLNGCGYNDWAKNTAKDVGNKQWDGTPALVLYTVITLNNNRLYWGKSSGLNDGTNGSKRHTEFDYASNFLEVQDSATAANFDGTYTTGLKNNCTYIGNSIISGNTVINTGIQYDATTGEKTSQWVVTNTEEIVGSYLDGQKINRTWVNAVITLYTDETVAYYNSQKACGYNNWVKNAAKDVGNKQWNGLVPDMTYTIRVMYNNRIYYGKTASINDGTTDIKRHTEFNFTATDPWIKSVTAPASADGSYSSALIGGSNTSDWTISGSTETNIWKNFSNTNGAAYDKWEVTFTTNVVGNYLDGEMVNRKITKFVITLYSDDAVNTYNSNNACGYSNWVKNVAKDVGDKQWDGTPTKTTYTIRLVCNNRLFYGKTTDSNDGTTDAKRHIEFDLDMAKAPVKL